MRDYREHCDACGTEKYPDETFRSVNTNDEFLRLCAECYPEFKRYIGTPLQSI